jgi:hypothetical protein
MEIAARPGHIGEEQQLAAIVEGLRAAEEEIAALEAVKVAQLAAAMRIALARMEGKHPTQRAREMELRSIAAEIGSAVRWSDRLTQSRMSDALDLVERFPATVDALAAGRITGRHAAAIHDAGCVIADRADRAAFEEVVLEWAACETVARTRDYARGLAEQLNPESITTRFERAESGRSVTLAELGDGLAKLELIGAAALIHGIHDRLTQQARTIRRMAAEETLGHSEKPDTPAGPPVIDARTLDQIRADLVCDMLLTGQPAIDPTADLLPGGLGAIRARVQVLVPALTAAAVDDRGASIDGTCPIDADTARSLMATAPGWDRILTHPVTGGVLAVDRYRAGKHLERFLAARDVHCRFPGCRQPARVCDHDHNRDWALGGQTVARNMACLCRRHHTVKTETDWTATQLTDGTIRWTSPLGRGYMDKVPPRVMFVPDKDPPPF